MVRKTRVELVTFGFSFTVQKFIQLVSVKAKERQIEIGVLQFLQF